MASDLIVRRAKAGDAKVLRDIYRPWVERTAVSFELEVPSVAEFERRIESAVGRWAWLVAELHGRQVGYAYGTAHRAREAYRTSVETSAYVLEDYQRQGIGRALYARLLDDLCERGYASAYAGITLPNEPSIGFHLSMGFEPIGVFPRVGWKLGAWHDVAWYYRPLAGPVRD
jgi:phosphinothricin acetyltransferase